MKTNTNKRLRNIFVIFTLAFISLGTTSCVFYYDEDYRRAEFYIDGRYIKAGSRNGHTVFYIDGNYIREGSRYGTVLYYVSGNHIRERSIYGRTVFYIDHDCIRDGSIYGETIYFLDGNYVYSYY